MNRKDIPEALLLEVEANCDVTWRDDATDTKFRGYIAGGMVYINDKLGEKADYEADGYPRTLLMEYCRYARDGALDVFENNYQSMILAMQNKGRVSRYVESTKQTS